ncbi:MAG: autotransporter [Solirubrobacteraceae bacterium]
MLAASWASGTLALSVPQARAAVASGARVLSLNENGSLHLTSKSGFTLNEQGLASGTVKGRIDVHLTIVSSSRVTAELNIYPSGGSITAHGSGSYHEERSSARFSGSMSIERGTGSYAHARGSGLSFSGDIQRSNDAVTVHVAGEAVD